MPINWINYISQDKIRSSTISRIHDGTWLVAKYDQDNTISKGVVACKKLTQAQAIARDWTK